ncbi:MAG: NAD(+) synthase [Coriobacteriales bacterium]|jgi:NAD+ synthase (glutamine-hydrolysing)|nr:NAD(+) synthase [Coriobacteriales bacterium]
MFIAVVQFNPKVGALRENCERALTMIDELASLAYPPDLVVFPAFALSGAELGGLVTHNAFAAEALDVARSFMQKASLPTLIGTVLPRPAMAGMRFVCEEEVLFARGGKGTALGFLDMYTTAEMQEYVESIQIKLQGLTLSVVLDDFIDPSARYNDSDAIISLIARPYQETNGLLTSSSQIDSLRTDALSNNAWIVVASLCGGEDAFVYEGASLVMAPDGSVVDSAPPFEEAVFTANLTKSEEEYGRAAVGEAQGTGAAATGKKSRRTVPEARKQDKKRILPLLPYEASWRALGVGLGDYVRKNGFEDVVLGISGGIDSAVVATLATDALGAEHVHGVLMPSPYSSEGSVKDAEALAQHLGIKTVLFPITGPFQNFLAESKAILDTEGSDTALQNLQARIRTVILMHLSNTYGWLLLNTGNKSEAAMGYSTLYGDTAGAIAPLGALYKTDVYGLANWRNSRSLVIPESILNKEPSAELYSGQKDTDKLPPYDTLDQILRLHIEENFGVDEILEFFSSYPIETSIDTQMILDVLREVSQAEFKRRQEPMAFQFDGINLNEQRMWPVTNGFADHSRDIIAPTEIVNYLSMLYREANPGGRSGGLNFLDN